MFWLFVGVGMFIWNWWGYEAHRRESKKRER
jgi:hypothetical protein